MKKLFLVLLAACTQPMSTAADDEAPLTCDGLAETACRAAPGCQAVHAEPDAPPPAVASYLRCAPTTDFTAIGVCSTLGAGGCASREDCITWLTPGPTDALVFEKCVSE